MRANLIHGKIPEPASLDAAKDRYRRVCVEIAHIESQIADDGRRGLLIRDPTRSYDSWRRAADRALALFKCEAAQLAAWIDAQSFWLGDELPQSQTTESVLFREAYDLLKKLELDIEYLEPEESELMRRLDVHFAGEDQSKATG